MKTTLNAIRKHEPCTEGWKKLLTHLGKTQADDEPLSLLTIIDSNGLDDALWCLRAVEGKDKEIRLFAVWCARQVQHLIKDQRSLDALDVAERYANGEATEAELTAARSAAWCATLDVAWSAAWHAADAAWCVVGATAWNAAAEAAREAAAWAAAEAAREAAVDAARATAWNAVRAARSAAWSAAWVNIRSIRAAAKAALDATREATRAKQEAELRRICEEG